MNGATRGIIHEASRDDSPKQNSLLPSHPIHDTVRAGFERILAGTLPRQVAGVATSPGSRNPAFLVSATTIEAWTKIKGKIGSTIMIWKKGFSLFGILVFSAFYGCSGTVDGHLKINFPEAFKISIKIGRAHV